VVRTSSAIKQIKSKSISQERGATLSSSLSITCNHFNNLRWADTRQLSKISLTGFTGSSGATGNGMSGRRPVVKGLVEALRTLRVRSCLRPVGAGNECPAGPDAGPHGSSPNQQNALVMAPALFLGLPSRSVGSHRFAVALDADRLAAKPRSC